MTLQLPAKTAIPTASNVAALHDGLTVLIADRPGAAEPWTFYEVLDDYLGPWKEQGYPVGYGKHYCMAFNRNKRLQRNPHTRAWVQATTVALQEPLRDFVVARFRAGTLPALTAEELKAFAFSVHPQGYVQGGFTTVVLRAPEMLPVIVAILSPLFNPASAHFGDTIRQTLSALRLVVSETVGIGRTRFLSFRSGVSIREE